MTEPFTNDHWNVSLSNFMLKSCGTTLKPVGRDRKQSQLLFQVRIHGLVVLEGLCDDGFHTALLLLREVRDHRIDCADHLEVFGGHQQLIVNLLGRLKPRGDRVGGGVWNETKADALLCTSSFASSPASSSPFSISSANAASDFSRSSCRSIARLTVSPVLASIAGVSSLALSILSAPMPIAAPAPMCLVQVLLLRGT